MIKRTVLYILTIFICMPAFAQKQQVRTGNKLYDQKKYKEAAAAYQQALQKNPTYTPGLFNLGNSLYQQKQFDASRKVMDATAKTAADKNIKAGANYNIGNTYMEERKWQEAVDAYKQTLRNNPQDADAKYNLSYALEMLKQQQNQGGGGNKNKQDQNKDKKDKGKNKDNKDGQDKDKGDKEQDKQQQGDQNKEGDKKEEQDRRPQPQPSKLSEQQAEQLLNALQQEEKKLQDKMKKEKGAPVKVDKDW